MKSHRYILTIFGACALIAGLAACGSSSPSASHSTTPSVTHSASTTAPSGAAAVSTITTNWEKFFSAKTPVSERASLLEDGSQFPTAALQPTGLAAEASAKVLKVTNVTASTATVTYDVLLGTTPALTNQIGTAVYQNGTWKVGVSSFCSLLKLETSGKNLPSVCMTA
jgi:hypothetical protein